MESNISNPAYEYLESYASLCIQSNVAVIPSIRKYLDNFCKNGAPDGFVLNGNGNELKNMLQPITDEYLKILLKPIPRGSTFLKKLDLSYNRISDEGMSLLAEFFKNDAILEHLNLSSNNITGEGAVTLSKALQLNESLMSLDMSHNDIGKLGGMAIAEMLQVNQTIETLRLASCKLESDSLIALAAVISNSMYLHILDISNNMLQNGGANVQSTMEVVMSHISRMLYVNKSLRDINLSRMCITDHVCITYIRPAISNNNLLLYLDLCSNRITRDGGVALASWLSTNTTLKALKLSCCAIQDEGAIAMSKMLTKNTTLSKLLLDYNKISGKGLSEIANAIVQNNSLRTLHLWGNNWDALSCKLFNDVQSGPIKALLNDSGKTAIKYKTGSRMIHTDFGFYAVAGELQVCHNI